jgi:hyperosmotically inducible periplasmic protein
MKRRLLICLITSLTFFGVVIAAGKNTSDDAIYDNVRRKLASDQVVKGGALKVDVHDGVVTLTGTVEQEKQKERAAKLTKKIAGVKSVTNELTVAHKGEVK